MPASASVPQRGDIWDVHFDPQVGAEIGKIRPAVIVSIGSAGRLPLHIVEPITTGRPHFAQYFWMLPIPATPQTGLTHASFADAFQVKSVAVERMVQPRGVLLPTLVDELAALVALCIGYQPTAIP